MRLMIGVALALSLAGCRRAAPVDEAPGDGVLANFTPPLADATPAPVRVIDNAVIRDLARGKTEGVYLIDLRHLSPTMRREIAAERAEDAACRERQGSACTRHDQMIAELKARGWCWGPDSEVEADRRWMRRGAGCHG